MLLLYLERREMDWQGSLLHFALPLRFTYDFINSWDYFAWCNGGYKILHQSKSVEIKRIRGKLK